MAPIRVALRVPAACRQDFEGDDGIPMDFCAAEDIGAAKLCVVAGATAEKLVGAASQHRQCLDELVGKSRQSVAQDEGAAVTKLGMLVALKCFEQRFRGSRSIRHQARGNGCAKVNVRRRDRNGTSQTRSGRARHEFAGRRAPHERERFATGRERTQQ